MNETRGIFQLWTLVRSVAMRSWLYGKPLHHSN